MKIGAQARMMEGTVAWAADWCTNDEVVVLSCVSMSLFIVVKDWQYQNILDEIDEATWDEMSEDRNAFLSETSTSPAVSMDREMASRRPYVRVCFCACRLLEGTPRD